MEEDGQEIAWHEENMKTDVWYVFAGYMQLYKNGILEESMLRTHAVSMRTDSTLLEVPGRSAEEFPSVNSALKNYPHYTSLGEDIVAHELAHMNSMETLPERFGLELTFEIPHILEDVFPEETESIALYQYPKHTKFEVVLAEPGVYATRDSTFFNIPRMKQYEVIEGVHRGLAADPIYFHNPETPDIFDNILEQSHLYGEE